MKIYISGKITGLPKETYKQLFDDVKLMLENKTDEIISPLDILAFDEELTWSDYMKADIEVLSKCDAIFLLENWLQSKGAKFEYFVAKTLGLQIFFQNTLHSKRFKRYGFFNFEDFMRKEFA